eukprot:gene32203-16752_t
MTFCLPLAYIMQGRQDKSDAEQPLLSDGKAGQRTKRTTNAEQPLLSNGKPGGRARLNASKPLMSDGSMSVLCIVTGMLCTDTSLLAPTPMHTLATLSPPGHIQPRGMKNKIDAEAPTPPHSTTMPRKKRNELKESLMTTYTTTSTSRDVLMNGGLLTLTAPFLYVPDD